MRQSTWIMKTISRYHTCLLPKRQLSHPGPLLPSQKQCMRACLACLRGLLCPLCFVLPWPWPWPWLWPCPCPCPCPSPSPCLPAGVVGWKLRLRGVCLQADRHRRENRENTQSVKTMPNGETDRRHGREGGRPRVSLPKASPRVVSSSCLVPWI